MRVRVQNEYGFWSAWGAAPLQIINTPGSAITLTAETGREVTLAWAASGFDYYIVYRDGTAIARTTEPLYTDRTSIGQVKYQVRVRRRHSDCADDEHMLVRSGRRAMGRPAL